MYARHELIWLAPAGWDAQPATSDATRAMLQRWRDNDWPLIVRRREPDAPADVVCAGLAAPPDPASGTRLRIPLQVEASYISRHERPLPLQVAAPAAPEVWRHAFAALAAAAGAYDMRVYGSFAMQALTGQSYLRPTSDIDIVFHPASASQLDAGVALLAAYAATLPLDGEIVFPSGQAVAWKEWHAAQDTTARVLVKAASTVQLRPPGALRAELEPA
jgi:phosphoribosyl-dephospho-CoA transferase